MADNRDLFPQDNPSIAQLTEAINQLTASLQEQRGYLSELNRNISSLGSQIRALPGRIGDTLRPSYTPLAPQYTRTPDLGY